MAQPSDLETREFRDQNNRVLSAMRDDLCDLSSRMDNLEQKVDRGFTEMRGKLDATAAGLDQIAGMLTTLIEQRGEQDDR